MIPSETVPANDRDITGLVFNVQKYALHDGPGIRTLVFLKGCPLHCRWCSNPESQAIRPQLAYNAEKCLSVDACRHCRDLCPQEALQVGPDRKIHRLTDRCDDCLLCTAACPAGALDVYGYETSVADILRRVEEDDAFYARSGGGLTLSGGEPLFQATFALALLREARRRRINTCMETCGDVPWPALREAAGLLNTLHYDLKCLDEELHRQWTGVSNRRLVQNLVQLKQEFPALAVTVRTPIVPGFNDDEKIIAEISQWVAGLPGTCYELLGYHRLGTPKYGYLGRPYRLDGTPPLDRPRLQHLQRIVNDG